MKAPAVCIPVTSYFSSVTTAHQGVSATGTGAGTVPSSLTSSPAAFRLA